MLASKRLFTFGCSFTNYVWPTWADIMSHDYDYFENWGKIGAGNHFILYSLIEAIQRKNITKSDTVAVMFTSIGREDRWIKGQWLTPGSVYASQLDENYIKNFTDPTGFAITNVAIIESIIRIISNLGCKFHLMSTVPLLMVDDSFKHLIFKLNQDVESQVYRLYNNSLQQIHPSVYQLIFNNNWDSRNQVLIPRARRMALNIFKNQYKTCAGNDWPSFEDFVNGAVDHVGKSIWNEIDQQFDFVAWRDRINTCRQDSHPTPLEHFEYLEKIGMTLTNLQKDFATEWNCAVLQDEHIKWRSVSVDRF